MPMKIATWNLCLGLFHKRDYVRTLLYEHDLDILTLQETELSPDIDEKTLQIKGYSLEVESNDMKRRVAIYIRNTIIYKRRCDLERNNMHLIILDVQTSLSYRIIAISSHDSPRSSQ
jgi:exonuclease III